MSAVICKKCGKEGFSKCPYCRSVFPERPEEDKEIWYDVEYLEHRIILHDPERVSFMLYEGETPERFLNTMRKAFANMNEKHIKVLTCCHSFEFKEGHSSSIGCGH